MQKTKKKKDKQKKEKKPFRQRLKEGWHKWWHWMKTEVLTKEMLFWILIAEVIFWSPVIVTTILALWVSPWYWSAVTSIIVFWAGPFTPAMELQIALAFLLKRIFKGRKAKKNKNKNELKEEQKETNVHN